MQSILYSTASKLVVGFSWYRKADLAFSKGRQHRVQKYRGTFLVPVPTVLFPKWYRSTGTAVLF